MPLFQKLIVKKYATAQSNNISAAYELFTAYFHNTVIQENILASKEEQFQEGFLRELFVKVLGYTLNPHPDFNLITEQKNETNAKKADGAIIIHGEVVGIIELKDHKTIDLKQIETQAFGYKNNNRKASYVITSNFEKLRFYIENAIDFVEFNLFTLTQEEFALLWLCLAYDNIAQDLPKQLKAESVNKENDITKDLYKDYSEFKRALFADLVANNPSYDQLTLFKKSQKLLDRLLFIFFAEDCDLLPANSIAQIVAQWEKLKELDAYTPLYARLQMYFGYMNTGHKGKKHDIFAYNGGLFKPDEVLDQVAISDEVLCRYLPILADYNFASEVDVNILGHIFENSLTEIEEITNSITAGEATPQAAKATSKRKKDGVFYTPRYITTYIVENTLGKLCTDKKVELQIDESEYFADKKRQFATKKRLDDKLQAYRTWLLQLTICDPACGSGAFLNAALDYLMSEHRLLDELTAKLLSHSIAFPDVENAILENNLFGVDINEESVEIAKLALWLRTAKPHRKLNSLNNNIKCGNSLISDPEVAGDKAFDWQAEFPQVFAKGGFDVVIGNPPYGVNFSDTEKIYLTNFDSLVPDFEIYIYFISLYKSLLKTDGLLSYIFPNTFLSTLFGVKYRQRLLSDTSVYLITDLSKDNTFEDASVRTCILSFANTNAEYIAVLKRIENNTFVSVGEYDKLELLSEVENILSLFTQNRDEKYIIDKVNRYQTLKDFHQVSQGLIPYDKYRGHDEFTIKNRIWHSTYQKDESYRKELKGGDLSQYYINWNGNLWISYGSWLAAPRDKKFFTQPRILLREITTDKLFSSYATEELYNTPSIINIIDDKGMLNLKYTLSILNSTLVGWFHNKTSPKANKGLFPKILINDVRNLPIKSISPSAQQPFIDLADKMLALNADLQGLRSKFLRRLQDNFEGVKITGALERFDTLDFAAFVKELGKQKIALSLKQQDEWEEYFSSYRSQCSALVAHISTTDRTIDMLVYRLYALTYDEVLTIDPNTPIAKQDYEH